MSCFCQDCGAPLTNHVVEGREREVCSACGTINYAQWKVSAGVRVVKDNKLLLVQRANDPWRGMWHMPAGYVEVDEEPWLAAQREAREETGLVVKVLRLVDCYSEVDDPRGNVLVFIYEADCVGGEISSSKDTQAVGFFSPQEIRSLPLAGMSAVNEIKDWLTSFV